MTSIKQCYELINKNLIYYAGVDMPKINENKEIQDKLKELYVESMKQTLDQVQNDIDKFHEERDFHNKVDDLHELINKSNLKSSYIPWRFFYDSQKTLDSLTFESKQEYLSELLKIDKEYDNICEKLENTVVKEHGKIMELVDTIDEVDDKLDKLLIKE